MAGSSGFLAGNRGLARRQRDEGARYRSFTQGKAMATMPAGTCAGNRKYAAHNPE
jgi:hypothetical protein